MSNEADSFQTRMRLLQLISKLEMTKDPKPIVDLMLKNMEDFKDLFSSLMDELLEVFSDHG